MSFGMFTEDGNTEIAAIVDVAKKLHLTWPETYNLLSKLAELPEFGEAMDTVVREMVYDACGFDTEFYF